MVFERVSSLVGFVGLLASDICHDFGESAICIPDVCKQVPDTSSGQVGPAIENVENLLLLIALMALATQEVWDEWLHIWCRLGVLVWEEHLVSQMLEVWTWSWTTSRLLALPCSRRPRYMFTVSVLDELQEQVPLSTGTGPNLENVAKSVCVWKQGESVGRC